MDFLRVRLLAAPRSLPALTEFYGSGLGAEVVGEAAFAIGATRLEFSPGDGEPFYHFALLAPGNRFLEVLDWARERTVLLADSESGEVVFDFDFWGAHACYFHDPAGNIVELIAHRGIGEADVAGPFAAAELLGLSELGLVGDPETMANALRRRLGLELWDGSTQPARLAFVGEPGRTLILAPPGRGWLPTGRPAEPHPVDAAISGTLEGEAVLEGSLHRVRSRRPP